MNRDAAQRFGHRFVTDPSLLFGIGAEDKANIREVKLRTGPATLIEDLGDDGKIERVALLWSAPGRVYLMSGAVSSDLMIRVANAIE